MNFDSRIQTGVSLHAYSTIRIGGKAANFLSVRSSEEVNEALSWVNENKVPLFILGSGSNTLFSDLGFSGLVLHNELKGIEWKETEGQVAARVASGENWDDFVLACIGKGLTGFEAMSGIPGQVGSTPIQNVGAYGQEVCAHIESVEVIECESGDRITIPKEDCRFGYRTSRFKSDDRGKYFVTAVNFLLPKDKQPKILYQELFHYVKQNLRYKNLQTIPEKLTAIRKAVLAIRKKKSMVVRQEDKNSHSLGSFFINPVVGKSALDAVVRKLTDKQRETFHSHKSSGLYKLSAAWLIEQSGFKKGYKHQSVMLSKNHCLAICNPGKASSKDVIELSELIVERVLHDWNIELKPEPGFVGEVI